MEMPNTAILAKANTIFFTPEDIAAKAEKSIVIFAKRLANRTGPKDRANMPIIKTNFAFVSPYLNSMGI